MGLSGGGLQSVFTFRAGKTNEGQPRENVQTVATPDPVCAEIASPSRVHSVQLHHRVRHVLREVATRRRPNYDRVGVVHLVDGKTNTSRLSASH